MNPLLLFCSKHCIIQRKILIKFCLMQVHSRSKSLMFQVIPRCDASDGWFQRSRVDITREFIETNLIVCLCLFHSLVYYYSNIIFQFLETEHLKFLCLSHAQEQSCYWHIIINIYIVIFLKVMNFIERRPPGEACTCRCDWNLYHMPLH